MENKFNDFNQKGKTAAKILVAIAAQRMINGGPHDHVLVALFRRRRLGKISLAGIVRLTGSLSSRCVTHPHLFPSTRCRHVGAFPLS
jgi:hypothetical protein